jgi:ABC-type glycerol-3-phosphate transport system substrate-binding protein
MLLKRRLLYLVAIAMLLLGLAPLTALHAQDANTVTITVGVPDYLRDVFNNDLLSKFEADHLNIKVKVVTANMEGGVPSDGLTTYLEAMQKYANSADVLMADFSTISPEATRAGYFLNLAPLATDDASLNADDFYPSLYNAFQWDKGIWALPTGTNINLMTYKPKAFDDAGLSYPDAKWTMDDLVNAINKLAVKDGSGAITSAAFDSPDETSVAGMLYGLSGVKMYDDSQVPDRPTLASPELEKVMDTWAALKKDGYVARAFNQAPMSLSPIFAILFNRNGDNPDEKRVGTLMPGGKAILDVQGFGVSAGSQFPEQAYEFIKFLTNRSELASRFSVVAARKSVNESANQGGGGNGGGGPRGPRISEELKPVVEEALANGITVSDARYASYFISAVEKIDGTTVDAHTALQEADAAAVKNQEDAIAAKANTVVTVATAIPVVLRPGTSPIKFGISSFVRPLPNEDQWDRLAQDFAATDTTVGEVQLELAEGGDLTSQMDKYDCVYLPYNGVPSAKLDAILSVDPYLSADTTFDKTDVIGNVMSQIMRDNKTWAVPINVQPSLLSYNSVKFDKAGVPAPTTGWTIDQFKDALNTLKPDQTDPPFSATTPGGTHLLALIAAYGGLPLDFRTNPATIDFTSPETVTAIRQVLDLAKEGYMSYSEIGNFGGVFRINSETEIPVITQELNGFAVRRRVIRGGGNNNNNDTNTNSTVSDYKPTLFPTGTKYNAISYAIGVGMISAKSQNPEGCFRWLSLLSRHPELFSSMPARHSLINDPTISAAQGADTTAVYNQIDAVLKDPNTLSLPSLFEGGRVLSTGFFTQQWLFQAFDAYVLNNADLDGALKDAESYAKGYVDCAASIPPYDPTSGQLQRDYNRQFLECAAKVDPRLKDILNRVP